MFWKKQRINLEKVNRYGIRNVSICLYDEGESKENDEIQNKEKVINGLKNKLKSLEERNFTEMTNRDKLIVDMEVKIKQLQDEHFGDSEIFAEKAKKKGKDIKAN